ncbi:MAG: putative metal-binding motif-containing protein [Archangium sp.]|nr:putative metal-binding motif-containing protein [Archangium sp.]
MVTTILRNAQLVCRDADHDSFGSADCQVLANVDLDWARDPGDCDDTNAAVYPRASELCDTIDNDCDALIDGADPQLELPLCANQTGICFSSRNTPSTCVNGAFLACSDASYGPTFGQSEAMCGSLDFNCDGVISRAIPCALQLGVCSGVTITDCTPGASCGRDEYGLDYEFEETRCDGLDNDCDGTPDDVAMKPCALQLGVCAGAITTQELCRPTGFAECGADQYGAAWEPVERSCDGKDNDCDGFTDAFDSDFLPCELQVGVCTGAQHLSPRCNFDSLARCGGADYGPTWEAEEQRCDGLDNDCDGVTDERCAQPDGGRLENVQSTGCGCGAIDSFLLLGALVLLARRRTLRA